jgi:WS/DGAT/MGAT family acyltransferase
VTGEQLSTLESSFLWFEQPGRPIHVGAVATFEGAPLLDTDGRLRLDDLRRLIDDRLDEVPRLRQRIAAGTSPLERPRWVDDPDFAVAHHVDEIAVEPPGDEAAFRRVAERVNSELFPPERPPWQMRFVTGLAAGRVGLVERAHHALVDGVGGVDVAAVFLDLDRRGRPPRADRAGLPTGPTPAAAAGPAGAPPPTLHIPASVAALGGWLRLPAEVVGAAASAARHPLATARGAAGLARGLATVAAEGVLAPSASLNVVPGDRSELAWVSARLDGVRAAGRAAGGTVNDVVLAAVTAGLRSLLIERRVPLPHDLALKALVPVSERGGDPGGDGVPALGNQVSALLAPLPVGDGDPARRLATIVASTRRLKASGEAAAIGAVLHAADLLPAPLARAVVRGVEHQPFVNLVVTNVPGPDCPLYLMGAEMLEAYPVLPLGANLSVGVAILSYNGTLHMGLTADADRCPDLAVFARSVDDALTALTASAGATGGANG